MISRDKGLHYRKRHQTKKIIVSNNDENLLAEYSAACTTYLHYDNYSWQVGSVLIAGVFVFWGFLLEAGNVSIHVTLLSSTLIFGILTCWITYNFHNRQIYLYILHRVREIEKKLHLYQHRRFYGPDEVNYAYRVNEPKGNLIEIAVYIILSNGTFLLPFFKERDNIDYTSYCNQISNYCNEQLIIWATVFSLAFIASVCVTLILLNNDDTVKANIIELEKDNK